MMGKVRNQKREGLLFLFVIATIIFTVLCVTIRVNASQENNSTMQVKSVLVESGDTLWDIASENYSDGYDSIEEYIGAIKECNHITSDKIYTGNYLIVPYYN